jgi:glyoxylase-like metal-dependent hydrolase (beta-lactamase superfamily II)
MDATLREVDMKEIVPGIFTWSWFSEPRQLDFNGFYVQQAGETILIDPPPCSDADIEEMERRGRPGTIVLTNVHHGRHSRALATRFDAQVLIHAADAAGVDAPVSGSFTDGATLPGGLQAVWVPASKSPGETAVHVPTAQTLIVGDALIGKPAGEVSLLPDDKFADVKQARAGIRRLLQIPFEALLVGDGACIPLGGPAAIRRFLARRG